MRITNNILSQNLLRNLQSAQGRMDDLQNQLSSGHRITKPSDDPAGVQNALRLKSNISSLEQWKNNADESLQYMNTTDSTLGDMTSMLQRVRDLTVEGANGTLSADDKIAIAIEVDQISEQLRMIANTQIGSKYIFSGTETNRELIKSDGTIWQGNSQDVKFEVGNNITLPISVNGQTLFKTSITGVPGVFDTLSALSTALKTNDATGINDALKNIDGSIDNVIAHRTDLGARANRMTALRDQLDSTSDNLKGYLSGIQDADIAKTIMDSKNQENTYKAALFVGAQIIQPSLIDFMS
ncbi:MAG: flagellar hook-associated protein FlgL [Desulfitobacteriaceae bacterium]